jgi:hypothetical protein
MSDKSIYRSRRARRVNAAVGAWCLIAALGIWRLYSTQPSARANKHVLVDMAIGLAIFGAVILARVLWSGTLILEKDRLTFRTEVRTVHIPKDQISDIDTAVRLRGVVQMSQPGVKLKSGSTRWLTDFSVPANRDLSEQAAMVEAMKAWLRLVDTARGVPPSTPIGTLAADRRTFWTGTSWSPTTSNDGQMQWDGSQWVKAAAASPTQSTSPTEL